MNRAVLRGSGGEVRWSYHWAATLDSWTLTSDSAGATLTASVLSHDACAVSQRPLTFVVPRPNGQRWRWSVTSLQIADGKLTAGLDPQE